ncbi:MAG: 3-oxoacyl-ACP synthase, partial [Synergistetes bacterium]|nr:3-oxoacyl-ACP synthase [Synergistota bacterium]
FLKEVIEGANLEIDDINWFIFHQANIRIIESVAKRLKIKDMDGVVVNLDKYGNTSAATVPIALDEIVREGKVKKGDKILLVSFGSGMTYGAIIFEW